MRFTSSRSIRRALALGGAVILAFWAVAGGQPTYAASGPFAEFHGRWAGSGTIRIVGSKIERVRCDAQYQVLDSSAHEIRLDMSCKSDTYQFDLAGRFQADAGDHISGQWTERTRGIGGNVIGYARGDRLQIHVESSAFNANLYMITRGRRQNVKIDSHGGGQNVDASIALYRR
jgi:hypothetical protein